MTITVSIGQFRQDIASYLLKAQMGHKIELRDEKKGVVVAEITGKKKFDPEAFGKALSSAAGVFTAKNHPEWKTKKDVIKWLEKSRAEADRTF
jgi:hypothetical protein